MEHFAGLDVSVKETSICIVDDTGRIVREVKVASEPGALLQVLKNNAYHFKLIGLEAGPLSQWLFSALAEANYAKKYISDRSKHSRKPAQRRQPKVSLVYLQGQSNAPQRARHLIEVSRMTQSGILATNSNKKAPAETGAFRSFVRDQYLGRPEPPQLKR